MNMTSIGDMAQSLVLRSRSAAIRTEMMRLEQELSTGLTADPAGRLGGDFAYLDDIEHNLARLGGFATVADEAALFADAAQQNLARMQDAAAALGADLLAFVPSGGAAARRQTGVQARAALDTVLGALNGGVGGRSLFAGTATDTAPMGSRDTLISALRAEVSGLGTGSAILAAVDDWFARPGGFQTVMYSGSDRPLAPVRIGADEQVSLSLRADDAAFRDLVRNAAVAVLATDDVLGLTTDVQDMLIADAGRGLMGDDLALTGLRAGLGHAQSRIETAAARTAAARSGLEMARNDLLAADPYETASRLEQVQFQLESLYAVTVRSSRLSLLGFLK